jgi:hypothetical protein
MPKDLITAGEFEERIAALCLSGTGAAFPRRQRDRHILYRCMVQMFDMKEPCSEADLNDALRGWLSGIGTNFEMDHVTLRRYLVDEGYVLRDAGGSRYVVNLEGNGLVEFDKEVSRIDSITVVLAAKTRAAERKREHPAQARDRR